MYLVVFYVGEYVLVGGWVCIQNRKVQNSLRSVGNCFASRSNFLLRCVRIILLIIQKMCLFAPIPCFLLLSREKESPFDFDGTALMVQCVVVFPITA
jgi:hypothetical protein